MTSPFPQITSPPQASAEVIVNEALETLKHEAVYGKDQSTTTGLTWGYYGGRWGGFSVADGTLTLTDASANYVVAAIATGVTSVSTSNAHWNDTTNYARVYKLTTAGGVVSAEEDHRAGPGGVHGGASASAGATLDTDGTLSANSDTHIASQKATKTYVDTTATTLTTAIAAAIAGLSWKAAVRAATTANGTLATAFANGQTIDGVTLATGDRILLKNQSSASANGIYTVNSSGAPTRSTDADSAAEMLQATVYIEEGTTLADSQWTCTTNAPITLGSTSLAFAQTGAGAASPTTTKGDLIVRSSSADSRLAIGANHSFLMPDSGATLGMKWGIMGGVPLSYFGTLANDGSTDDSAVLTAALASGVLHIDARGLNLAIPSQISLVAGVTLDISGSTITTAGSTISTFKADSIDDWHLIAYGATIIGAGTTTGSAKGVSVIQCNRYSVRGLRCKNIKGHGFFVAPGTLSTPRGDQGLWIDCFAEACFWGWEDTPGTGAEYNIVTNLRTSGCTTWGVKTSAGNVAWHGGHDIDNVGDGFVMVGGANHAHGIVTGRSCNHNGTNNLSLTGIVNGQTFVGCHFYEKIILLDGCKGVVFVGGAIDTPTITVNSGTGSGQCVMIGVYFPGDYASPPAVGGTAPSSLARWNCTGPGAAASWIGPRQSICIACGDETTAITAATGKVTFRMPFAFYVQEVRASVTTAPTGSGNLTVDINESGTSIISTKLTFDATEKTTTTAATPAVISDHDIADDAEITIDVDAVSGTITGAGLKVYLIGYPQAA